MRQRAPVSSRTAAPPASGSTTSRSADTTSRTSGSSSSPPRPTTSTGRSRARSAAASALMSARRRTSTAVVGGSVSASAAARHRSATASASHARSASTSSCRATRTSPAGAPGRGRSSSTATPLRPQGLGDAVGQGEHLGRVAEAGQQPVAGGRDGLAVGVDAREVGDEPRQVRRARAAPAVDRLEGVADRGDRGALVVREQRTQHDPLRVPGVLVLVEQHRAERLALGGPDLVVGLGEAGGRGHLVGEVEAALGALALGELADQRQERRPEPLRGDLVGQRHRQRRLLPLGARGVLHRAGEALGVERQRCWGRRGARRARRPATARAR